MTAILTPGLTISSGTKIRKIRELPVAGTLLKKMGDIVRGDEIVARAERPGDLQIIKAAERMGIEPQEVIQGLKVVVGNSVQEGQLLCQHAGLFGLLTTKLTSPVSGTVEMLTERTGHIGIREPSRNIEINGYISGKIIEAVEGRSLTIETSAVLVQGIFGIGGEQQGVLCKLDVPSERSVTIQDLPADCAGKVLVGGTAPTLEAVIEASKRGAKGLICGSIDDLVLKGFLGRDLGVAVTGDEDLPMTLIITEGFGNIPMDRRVSEVLDPVVGKMASINGATQVRAGAVRPEIIVSIDSQVESNAVLRAGLDLGRRVRLIRFPYFGAIGQVVELPSELQKIETGAFARVLKARLEDGREVVVPRNNVELV